MSFFPALNFRIYGEPNEDFDIRKKRAFKKLVSCDPDEGWRLFRLVSKSTNSFQLPLCLRSKTL